jgi:hypothetical protein
LTDLFLGGCQLVKTRDLGSIYGIAINKNQFSPPCLHRILHTMTRGESWCFLSSSILQKLTFDE